MKLNASDFKSAILELIGLQSIVIKLTSTDREAEAEQAFADALAEINANIDAFDGAEVPK